MAKVKIAGKVTHQQLEGGFWGIIGKDGRQWRPVKMPDQLKYDGMVVEVVGEEVEDEVSFQMWGNPIRIISFETATP